jgi:hypothetical protein
MALERKDIRAKLDADMHAALSVLSDVDGLDLGEFIERELVAVIRRRLHDATVIAERTARLGISGNGGEKPGTGRRE